MASSETNNKTEGKSAANQVPEWLTLDLFEEFLPKDRKCTAFRAVPALGAGENYATQMLRVEIEVVLEDDKKKPMSFMVKIHQNNTNTTEMMKRMHIFEKENDMYQNIVPELEELYRNAGVEVKFGPKHYKIESPDEIVLLEDLHTRGFKNVNRLEGLDLEHTKNVLKKLAQWHAASAVRVDTKGKYDDWYVIGVFDESSKVFMNQMHSAMGVSVRKAMETYKGYETFKDDLAKLRPHSIDEIFKSTKVDPNEFNVLNHGDCWANNIMFQYDAFGKIKETYFVDYQIPKYGTPAQDLFYFLLSSTKFEIKLQKFDYFIRYYHERLVESLELLKYAKPIPKLRDIHKAMFKHGIWGYNTALGVMAAVLVDPSDMANIENVFGESETADKFRWLMYNNARYRKNIEAILPWLQNRGALEC